MSYLRHKISHNDVFVANILFMGYEVYINNYIFTIVE